MCGSYPFFLCLCLYSTYVLTLHILLLWPHFGFDMLFDLSALLFALREAFKLQPVKREESRTHWVRDSHEFKLQPVKARLLYSFIFVHIPYFYFSITGYFYFRRVVRNDSLVRRLRRQRSRPCAVGRLGTVERRRTVTVFVKPLLESPFLGRGPGNRYILLFFSPCTNKPYVMRYAGSLDVRCLTIARRPCLTIPGWT